MTLSHLTLSDLERSNSRSTQISKALYLIKEQSYTIYYY